MPHRTDSGPETNGNGNGTGTGGKKKASSHRHHRRISSFDPAKHNQEAATLTPLLKHQQARHMLESGWSGAGLDKEATTFSRHAEEVLPSINLDEIRYIVGHGKPDGNSSGAHGNGGGRATLFTNHQAAMEKKRALALSRASGKRSAKPKPRPRSANEGAQTAYARPGGYSTRRGKGKVKGKTRTRGSALPTPNGGRRYSSSKYSTKKRPSTVRLKFGAREAYQAHNTPNTATGTGKVLKYQFTPGFGDSNTDESSAVVESPLGSPPRPRGVAWAPADDDGEGERPEEEAAGEEREEQERDELAILQSQLFSTQGAARAKLESDILLAAERARETLDFGELSGLLWAARCKKLNEYVSCVLRTCACVRAEAVAWHGRHSMLSEHQVCLCIVGNSVLQVCTILFFVDTVCTSVCCVGCLMRRC